MVEHIGPYEILSKLGSGGMGTVYRARDTRSGGLVALKVLKDDIAEDPELARRFEQEANTLRRLNHENIVHLIGYGSDDGAYFIAMELVEGESLAQRLKREGRLLESEVRRIGIAVAAALEAAHGQRIIHRDIKPGNILLGANGSVKVSDFGVARVLDETRRTRTGTFLGSLAYSAPEAFDGRSDERSDLYSLGCVLYECYSGKTPFRAETPIKMLELHRWESPDVDGAGIPASQHSLIEELLEKQPHRRPADAATVLTALTATSAPPDTVDEADPVTGTMVWDQSEDDGGRGSATIHDAAVSGPTPPKSGRRHGLVAALGGGGIVIAVVGAVIFMSPLGGAGSGGSATATPSVTATVAPTATPLAVQGFPDQTIIKYAGRTLTVSVSCGEGDGLRGVPELGADTAVLFDLLEARTIPLWGAPGYVFSIDAVFVDEAKRVTAVFPGIAPGSTVASSEVPIRYAIELAAGRAALHQLTPGTGLVFDSRCESASGEQAGGAAAGETSVADESQAVDGTPPSDPGTAVVSSPVPDLVSLSTDRPSYASGDNITICAQSIQPVRVLLSVVRPDESTVVYIPNPVDPNTASDILDGERCLDLIASSGLDGDRTLTLVAFDDDGVEIERDVVQFSITTTESGDAAETPIAAAP